MFSSVVPQEDHRIRRQALRHPLGGIAGKPLVLEHQRQLRDLALGLLLDLTTLVLNLGGIQTLLRLTGQIRPASHRDTAGNRLSDPGNQDGGAPGARSGHARHDAERHEQPVLHAKHDLAHARQPLDPGRLTQRVVTDVLAGLVADPLRSSTWLGVRLVRSRSSGGVGRGDRACGRRAGGCPAGASTLTGDDTGEKVCPYAADWWCDPGRGRLGARPRVLLCLTPTLC